MKYVQGAIGLPLVLSIDKYDNIKWYDGAEFAVNKDMSSRSGNFMTMGTSGAYVGCIKQKFNTQIQLSSIFSECTMS